MAFEIITCRSGQWEARDCNSLCRETHGPDFISHGCTGEPADPCACIPEYDMVDGGEAMVLPEDLQ